MNSIDIREYMIENNLEAVRIHMGDGWDSGCWYNNKTLDVRPRHGKVTPYTSEFCGRDEKGNEVRLCASDINTMLADGTYTIESRSITRSFAETLERYEQAKKDNDALKLKEIEDSLVVTGKHKRYKTLGYHIPWRVDDVKGDRDIDKKDILQNSFKIDYTLPKMTVLKNIIEAIIDRFPNSCLSFNNKNQEIEVDDSIDFEIWIEEAREFFSHEVIHLCGCGASEETETAIFHVMAGSEMEYKERGEYLAKVSINGVFEQTLRYLLDSSHLMTHGSSIGGAWLTNFGKTYQFILKHVDVDCA